VDSLGSGKKDFEKIFFKIFTILLKNLWYLLIFLFLNMNLTNN